MLICLYCVGEVHIELNHQNRPMKALSNFSLSQWSINKFERESFNLRCGVGRDSYY